MNSVVFVRSKVKKDNTPPDLAICLSMKFIKTWNNSGFIINQSILYATIFPV